MSVESASVVADRAASRPLRVSYRALRNGALWLLVFTGSMAKIEPSPYEVMFLVAVAVFLATGVSFHRALAPLVITLAAFNFGGVLALAPYLDFQPGVTFTLISIYMAATAIFFGCVMLDDTRARLDLIKRAYVWSGVLVALLGAVGYFASGELHDLFTRYDRATGSFKDPNVLGPFLVAPIVWLADELMRGAGRAMSLRARFGWLLARMFPLTIMLIGLFLTFSRGAWGVAAGAVVLCVALRFLVDSDARQRRRIVAMSLVGLVGLVAMLAIALSLQSVREVFEVRASLNQDYDAGELGRFGAQLRSIPMLLERPLGFGPLRFHIEVGNEDPHNVYVNAFASYGWIGGLAYFALIACTLYVGWRLALRPGPYRTLAIPVWSALFLHILQGMQIDTDHWRHLYLLFGLVWGLAAASDRAERRGAPAHLRASV